MDRAALNELFDYTGWAWERIARTIDGLPPEQFGAQVAGSGWPALSDCVEHFTAAYDGWLNDDWAWNLGESHYPRDGEDYPGTPELKVWAGMKEYRAKVRGQCREVLDRDDGWLFTKVGRDYGDGVEVWSPADTVGNLLLHERGHHGDLNTLFHQLDVRSYIIDYRYFLTRPDEFAMDDGG
jgi:uncharacterized damage-inducible protein DinB